MPRPLSLSDQLYAYQFFPADKGFPFAVSFKKKFCVKHDPKNRATHGQFATRVCQRCHFITKAGPKAHPIGAVVETDIIGTLLVVRSYVSMTVSSSELKLSKGTAV